MQNTNIIKVELKSFVPPLAEGGKQGELIKWGVDNQYPNYLINLTKRSVKHNAVLNGKVKYVVGSGVEVQGNSNIINNVSNIDTISEQLRKVAYDYETFNAFALEVLLNASGGFGSINHIRVSQIRFDVNGNLLYKKDWNDRKEQTKTLEKYNSITKKGVLYYREYSIDDCRYPIPSYVGAINYIETDAAISSFRVNNIKNGFAAGTIVNFTSSIPSPEEQEDIARRFKKKFQGEENAGEVLITFSNGIDKAPQVIPVTPNNFDKLFTDLDKATSDNIFIGHSITSPMIMGVRVEGQLGGRAEIVEAHELFQFQYVDSRQKAIEDVYNYILKPYATTISITPLNTIKQVLSEGALMSVLTKNEIRKMAGFEPIQETTPTQMSACNHDEVFEKLKALGSDEYKILKYGFAVDSNQQAEYYENVLKSQKFSTIPELDLKVLQYLRENKLASENEIATALKQPLKDVVNSVKALQDGGFLKGNIGVEIEITTKGADELVEVPMLEVETRYTYAVRSNVAPASKSRDFCVQLMALSASGRTWSRQEIESITNEQGTSAWRYRGGWYHNPNIDANTPYCRHEWKQVIVTKK